MIQKAAVETDMENFWLMAKYHFSQYLKSSTIHGVKYIAEKDRSWSERIWWILVISFSFLGCGKLISDAWNINPIIISFTDKPTPIWQIPFPVVIICPKAFVSHTIFNLTGIFNRLKNYELSPGDLTEEENLRLVAVNNFCRRKIALGDYRNQTNCNECLKVIREIKILPEELFVECRFQNRAIDCKATFKEIILDQGLCYTFNGVPTFLNNSENLNLDWAIDDGYKPETPLDVYPRRALGAGRQFGLSVRLKTHKRDIFHICHDISGFWIEFTMPYDFPRLISNVFTLSLQGSLTFAVEPRILKTSNELRGYPVDERKCYFSNERRLKYFKQYTQNTCETECEIELVLKNCGCYLIFIEDRGDIDTCGPLQQSCTIVTANALHLENFSSCKCLPACSSISYDSVLSTTRLNITAGQEEVDYSELTIYFKDSQFMTSERSEIYGVTGFLANCGGLLGLCLGVSVISLFEIFYFCVIRICFGFRGDKVNDREHAIPTKTSRIDRIIKDLAIDYTQNTTIHGLNYVADATLSWAERFWWAIVALLSISCCGSLIIDVFRRYEQSPVIISYAREETIASQIPFPAVTVCPQFVTEHLKDIYYNLKVRNVSLYGYEQTDMEFMTAVAQVCDPGVLDDIDPENRTSCETCAKYLRDYLPPLDYVLTLCSHILYHQQCSTMFKEVVTEEGVCYTYNGLDVFRGANITDHDVEWTLENGYRNNTEQNDVYPRAGSSFPLIVELEVLKVFNDGLCKGPILGFKVYLHLPNEMPHISKHYYLVPYKQTVQISAIPKMIITAPELRQFSVEKRQCFFSDERYLRFFRYYTQRNCEFECVVNLTVSVCGCLRFDMPEIPGVKFCGVSEMKCYRKVDQLSIEQNFDQSQFPVCNCLPSCTSISYDAEVNPLEIPDESIIMNHVDPNYMSTFSFAEISVYLKTNQIVALERSQLYGTTELMASCGGLLGLFLGFSIVSILELVYFCTIRLICDLQLKLLK